MKRNLHILVTLLVLSALGAGSYLAVNSSLFNLNQVSVEPLSADYPFTIEQALDLAKVPLGRINLFTVSLAPIEERLMRHAWVKGVVLSKQFPHTLVLKVIERKPVSLLNESNGRVMYIERDGASFEDKSMVYAKDLPMITGFSVNDSNSLMRVNGFIKTWFLEGEIVGLKLSSVSYDVKNGLKALVTYPLKNKLSMRATLELGLNIDEASVIPKERLRKVLNYLYERSTPASKIWLGDGKKIVVKVSRGS